MYKGFPSNGTKLINGGDIGYNFSIGIDPESVAK